MKVGIISDTHSAGSGQDLPQEVFRALSGVEMILHCGDLECIGVLDILETIAPVLAVRGYEDPVESGDRLADTKRVVSIEGISIGMVHDIQWPTPSIYTTGDGTSLELPDAGVKDLVKKKFGQTVDIVAFGDTHEELICYCDGLIFINPGSPTYPGRQHARGGLGTLGMLDISKGAVNIRILDLQHLN
tara:strand:- start:85 stop:648 length:564 start_codon:yes stop_codon:yes gene_type:complete